MRAFCGARTMLWAEEDDNDDDGDDRRATGETMTEAGAVSGEEGVKVVVVAREEYNEPGRAAVGP